MSAAGRSVTDGDHGQALGALAGLDAALPLVESEAPAQLRRRACRLLARARGLPQVDCLALDTDGRRLSAGAGNAAYRCDDFRHPYAHVIRSGAPCRRASAPCAPEWIIPTFRPGWPA